MDHPQKVEKKVCMMQVKCKAIDAIHDIRSIIQKMLTQTLFYTSSRGGLEVEHWSDIQLKMLLLPRWVRLPFRDVINTSELKGF